MCEEEPFIVCKEEGSLDEMLALYIKLLKFERTMCKEEGALDDMHETQRRCSLASIEA